MSEVIDEKSVEDYYAGAYDIVGFMKNNCDDFIEFTVQEAESFFNAENYSPIVEQSKRKSYMIDYFFLVACLADYVQLYVKKIEGASEELSKEIRDRIRNDFGENGELMKNGKFLLAVLNFFGYVIPSSHWRFMYLQIGYERKESEIVFVQNGILLNGHGIERFKSKLENFCRRGLYEELAKGPSGIQKMTNKKIKERIFVEDFRF